MKFKIYFAMAVMGVLAGNVTAQEDRDATIKALLEKVEALEQKVKILERHKELETEAADAKKKDTPVLTAGKEGFSFRSADTNFVIKFRGGLQADGRFFFNDTPANDTFLLRRVRPSLEGTVFGKYDFKVMTDFASGISATPSNNAFLLDAYGNARLFPGFQIQAGKFKEPVGLERLQSWQNLLFAERGLPTQLVPNRDVGIMVHGELFSSRLNYAAGAFNGTADGGSNDFDTGDKDKDVAARLFAHPFRETEWAWVEKLGIGISGTIGNHSGELRGYSSPGQQRFFSYRSGTTPGSTNVVADGELWRVSPQAYYYYGPFGLLGEYVISNHRVRRDVGATSTFGTIQNTAWQIMASYYLTGEDNSFKPVSPRKPFSLADGSWGAWEVAARIGQIDVDDDAFPLFASPNTSATEALSWGVGLNWYLNSNVKVNLNYEHTDFTGGSRNAALATDEHLFLTRAQFTF